MRPLHVSRFVMSIAVPFVMFPAIYLMQRQLGWEVALFPLYMFPVAKLSWEFGWRGAAVSVVLATCLWLLGSSQNEQPFSTEWIRAYNALVRGFIFLAGAVFVLMFKAVIEQHRRRMEAMRALLNVCHGCGSVQGSDGRWIQFEQLAAGPSRQTCECPTCAAVNRKL
jgi:hypothetical protein